MQPPERRIDAECVDVNAGLVAVSGGVEEAEQGRKGVSASGVGVVFDGGERRADRGDAVS
ncbi:hypothetical protein [Micromonospora sp. NPDC005113]